MIPNKRLNARRPKPHPTLLSHPQSYGRQSDHRPRWPICGRDARRTPEQIHGPCRIARRPNIGVGHRGADVDGQDAAATGSPIYFCKPSSPWQRGTNENTNGLLRQYLPKGTDLAVVPPGRLQAIADELNDRPRRTLESMTPTERYAQIGAMTA